MTSLTNNKIKISFLILSLIVISGCSVWTDFKAYFNTYYNASKLFEEVENEILDTRESLFSFGEEKVTGNQKKQLEEVIKKTSNILQYHANSSYFEDALLMTGKSFYYQQNYTRALRKFEELLTLKNSNLLLEAQLWLGKTQLKLRNFNKGLKILSKAQQKAKEQEEFEILTEIYKTRIGYLLAIEKDDEAISLAKEFLTIDIDDELKAEIQYEIGLLYEKNGDYKNALESFKNVFNYSPTFEIEFNSKFELAVMEKENGNVEKSLEMFEELKDEDKFSDRWGDIDLEVAKVYYAQKDIEEALNMFAIADTTYPKTKASGEAAFYRGEIIENYYHDLDSALVFYKKALSSMADQEIKDMASRKKQSLNKYLKIIKSIKETNQKILYATDEEVFIQDSLDYAEKMRLDSLKNSKEERNNLRGRRKRKRITANKYQGPQRPKISVDSLHSLNSKYMFEMGNLLFTEFNNPDTAFLYYNKSLEEKEDNPNAARIYYAMGNYYLIKNDSVKAKEMFQYVYDNFKDDPIMNEAARQLGKPIFDFEKDEVADAYLKAEAKYDSSDYEGAIKSLFKIYHENPKSKYAAKSLYTIGWILENDLNNPDSAASIYDTLNTKYRSSEFARAVVVKLTGYKQEQRRLKAIQDSIKKANEIKLAPVKTDSTKIKQQQVTDSLQNKSKADTTLIIPGKNKIKKIDRVPVKSPKDKLKKVPDHIK